MSGSRSPRRCQIWGRACGRSQPVPGSHWGIFLGRVEVFPLEIWHHNKLEVLTNTATVLLTSWYPASSRQWWWCRSRHLCTRPPPSCPPSAWRGSRWYRTPGPCHSLCCTWTSPRTASPWVGSWPDHCPGQTPTPPSATPTPPTCCDGEKLWSWLWQYRN